MKLSDNPPVHLTYCLNIHPGESWEENFSAINTCALSAKERISPDAPFGLGLRLSNRASVELSAPEAVEKFKAFLDEHDMYVFTVNGFPYGSFSSGVVKQDVYKPDWRNSERTRYTMRLADILAQLLPEHTTGSISTVPCSYKDWIKSGADREAMAANLVECAFHLAELRAEKSVDIKLGLEPEPDCLIGSTDEAIGFFGTTLLGSGCEHLAEARGMSLEEASDLVLTYIGICLDTCHAAVEYEDPEKSILRLHDHGIPVCKIQVCSALSARINEHTLRQLRPFCEDRYLHQTKMRGRDGGIRSFKDLPECMGMDPDAFNDCELRTHFHLPLYFDRHQGLQSTSSYLREEFFQTALAYGVQQFEIETYTFDVLPEAMRPGDVVSSIVREYQWLMPRIMQSISSSASASV
ncbi:metabolite traffic protein EboE [Fibrobacterota bacterium]